MSNFTLIQLPLPFEESIVEIPLTRGYITIVDAIDSDLCKMVWHTFPNGNTIYAKRSITIRGKSIALQLHRVILERKIGRSLKDGDTVDHIDGNGLNNRRDNLRLASRAENRHNSKRPRTSTSGYKGVYYFARKGVWHARIGVHGRRIHLGYFKTAIEAYEAYCKAVILYHGEFGRTE